MIQEHTVKEVEKGIFQVKNELNNEVYGVFTGIGSKCSCPAYKYSKRRKDGKKLKCKHIRLCEGIKVKK